ncbi:hypothetical protein AB0H77_31155 [Streptomyces sp. NPDC050844]|uniref:hypothetical protein n=1 Tax=Streptomyces sp. NPDC050844 TaxID=3155790 RepID=UPI0033FF5FF2
MELVRASLDPAARTVLSRRDSPICQVVTRAAKADLEVGAIEHVTQLAIGAGVAAAGLTSWLATERQRDTAEVLTEIEQLRADDGQFNDSVVGMLRSLLTGPPGMTQAAEFMVTLFHEDEGALYDLIVDLGEYTAAAIETLAGLGISVVDETLADLEGMLVEFFAG